MAILLLMVRISHGGLSTQAGPMEKIELEVIHISIEMDVLC